MFYFLVSCVVRTQIKAVRVQSSPTLPSPRSSRPGRPSRSQPAPNSQTPKLHPVQPKSSAVLLVGQPVADQGVDAVVARAEAAQLDALAVLDLLGIAVAPLDRHIAVCIGVDEHVEGAVPVQLR